MLVISSFDFSGFSDFIEEGVTKVDHSLYGGLVGLDGGGGGDLSQQVEDFGPGLSFEVGFGVFLEVLGNLGESGGSFL